MIKNVQRIAACTLLLVLAHIAGCARPQETDEEESHDAGSFGSTYQIITNEFPAAPDEPPAILSDSLSVMVAYPGGCEDHDFDLASRVTGDSAELWLRHNSRDDRCEALISERLQFELPDRVLNARRIHLLHPEGDVPFVLRWDLQTATEPEAASDAKADTLN